MKIYIASDHAGFEFKKIIQTLSPDWEWEDLGPTSADRVDYPDFAKSLAEKVSAEDTLGVLICGSGIGMSIGANKVPGVRAAVVENPLSGSLAREHNHANVLCLGARFVAPEYGAEILKAWKETEPGGGRHAERVKKLNALDLTE